MFVGRAELELLLPESYSLKDKRQVLRSLLVRLRQRLNLAAAEVGGQEQWNRAVLGLAAVGNEAAHVREVLDQALRLVEQDGSCEIIRREMEVI